jgi:hypothetical protein
MWGVHGCVREEGFESDCVPVRRGLCPPPSELRGDCVCLKSCLSPSVHVDEEVHIGRLEQDGQ